MPAPENRFRTALQEGKRSVGLWMGLCDPYAAEVVGRAGFDWVLIDGEHAPNDLAAIVRQLQVLDPHVAPIVRLPMGEPWLVKQVLDAGAQTLLMPMVNTADEARALVQAMRYPPEGIRGMGYVLGRASQFGAVEHYVATANDQMCLIVQIETRAALDNLDDILAVDGVDAAFVGPADLAADMGFGTDINAPQMLEVVADTLRRITAAGKPAGIIDFSDDALDRHFANGAQFVAVGADIVILSRELRALSSKWKDRIT
ncbi:MAG: HpcH/HpaI aldolase/citrate lyase family protein [Paracoccaceae bacterium]|nr:HpcH/HpaI aldolase/citrate lyase family protein [Paracoccaceae bacterium]